MFSWTSLRGLFISSLKTSIIFIRLALRQCSCASAVLAYPGLPVVGKLGSGDALFPWLLLIVLWRLPLLIWVRSYRRFRCWLLSLFCCICVLWMFSHLVSTFSLVFWLVWPLILVSSKSSELVECFHWGFGDVCDLWGFRYQHCLRGPRVLGISMVSGVLCLVWPLWFQLFVWTLMILAFGFPSNLVASVRAEVFC